MPWTLVSLYNPGNVLCIHLTLTHGSERHKAQLYKRCEVLCCKFALNTIE